VEDQRFCLDDSLRLQLSNGLADSVRWEIDGQSVLVAGNAAFVPVLSEPGSYPFAAVVYNASCNTDTLTGSLELVDCNLSRCTLFAPNAFTPQGDGTNDFFKPVLGCVPEFYDLRVFNRWGQEVFRTFNPDTGWNGKTNGQDAAQGTYQYVLYFRFAIGETRVSSGSLRLLR
jgi:gliding motility-associated-like protein